MQYAQRYVQISKIVSKISVANILKTLNLNCHTVCPTLLAYNGPSLSLGLFMLNLSCLRVVEFREAFHQKVHMQGKYPEQSCTPLPHQINFKKKIKIRQTIASSKEHTDCTQPDAVCKIFNEWWMNDDSIQRSQIEFTKNRDIFMSNGIFF